jgi:hypothetical protein
MGVTSSGLGWAGLDFLGLLHLSVCLLSSSLPESIHWQLPIQIFDQYLEREIPEQTFSDFD